MKLSFSKIKTKHFYDDGFVYNINVQTIKKDIFKIRFSFKNLKVCFVSKTLLMT